MEWTKEDIVRLEKTIAERWIRFKQENETDRKNLSELWNLHIKNYGITGLRAKRPTKGGRESVADKDLIDTINFRNSLVADALCVRNPDRPGQYLFIPRETASKILMLGMP
jgi:hypothetical protein